MHHPGVYAQVVSNGSGGGLLLGVWAIAALAAFVESAREIDPPRTLDDACAIFLERPAWRLASADSAEAWGIPESFQLAVIHQESRFRARARPGRRLVLGFLPGPRTSSAYGYGQVIDATWRDYRKAVEAGDVRRDDYEHVVDFIGWYASSVGTRLEIPHDDAYALYLAYTQGPSGYREGRHEDAPTVRAAARKVAERTDRYAAQLVTCPFPDAV